LDQQNVGDERITTPVVVLNEGGKFVREGGERRSSKNFQNKKMSSSVTRGKDVRGTEPSSNWNDSSKQETPVSPFEKPGPWGKRT